MEHVQQIARPTKGWTRRKQARPGEILDAALKVFAEKGFAAARMEDIARRAGDEAQRREAAFARTWKYGASERGDRQLAAE